MNRIHNDLNAYKDSLVTAELMIYALIAAGLVFWLRSILGTRNEDEPKRPVAKLEISQDGKIIDLNVVNAQDKSDIDNVTLISELMNGTKGNMAIADQNAEKALIDLAKVDRDFDIYVFLQAAQDAFVYVVESFAEGDRETLRDLLSPQVYKAFDHAITSREEAKESMETEIRAIQKSEVIEARLDGKMAFVTVRFWADETSVTKDESSNIVQGDPDKITQMRDVWTFSRDIKSRDPRWLVVETREDGDGDNENIPNTH